ncbi:MAG TPA: hypothetical protein VF421_10930 [Niabella sp.]
MVVLKFRSKLNAFSILESVTTMVLILIIFFIALQFFVSLNQSGFSLQKEQAKGILNDFVQTSLRQKNFTTDKMVIDSWPVTREKISYKNLTDVDQIIFTIYKRDSAATPLLVRYLLVANQLAEQKIDRDFE